MEQDRLNWLLGRYISIGYHEPKKYPKEPVLSKDIERKPMVMSDSDMERMAKRNTIILGGKIK